MSTYKINGNDVNDRIDWRQRFVAGGVTGRRAETFPGDGAVYLRIGKIKAPGVIVTGWLEGNTLAGVTSQMDVESDRMADTTLSDLFINGVAHLNQHLAGFEQTTLFTPFRDDGGVVRIMVGVRYTWQGVRP